MSEIDARIEKLHRRLHLINKIKSGKIKIPKDFDLDNFEMGNLFNLTLLDTSFSGFDNFEDFKIDKYLTNNGLIEANDEEEIVQFTYLKPPNFMTLADEIVSEVFYIA